MTFSNHPPDESAHLSDLRKGDAAVWGELAQTVLPKVRQALNRRAGTGPATADPDDAVQSAVRLLLRELHSPDAQLPATRQGLEGWLVVTSWRKWRDQNLKDRRRTGSAVSERPGSADTPLDQLLAEETAARLADLSRDLEERLSDDHRAVLTLWMDGRSQRDIAGELGMTRSRVESSLAVILGIAARIWRDAAGK